MILSPIAASAILILILTLMALSLLSIIAAFVFRHRLSDETAQVLFDLFPLELSILFLGSPFLCVALLLLSQ